MTIEDVYRHRSMQKAMPDIALKLLLCHVNGFPTVSELFIHWQDEMRDAPLFDELARRVISGEPLQYVIGEAVFLNRRFAVDESVLIPRPETEELATMAIRKLVARPHVRVIDLGTGSGCIAISLKLALPSLTVLATDISSQALEIAKKNAAALSADITFYQGDWLVPLLDHNLMVDAIVCNPPYIESRATVDPVVYEYEPHLALFAPKGTFHHRLIIEQARDVLRPHGFLMLEIDEGQAETLADIATNSFPDAKIEISRDLQGKNRFLTIERP